jgi:hypothetical protein
MSGNRSDLIHRLWDELADFDASRSDEALLQFMESLCLLVGARDAFWMGAVRMNTSFPLTPTERRGLHLLMALWLGLAP